MTNKFYCAVSESIPDFFFIIFSYQALRISLIQMNVGKNKVENVSHALNCIKRTVSEHKPQIVALPECFNSPYGTKYFDEYAESVPDGYTCGKLSEIAKELSVYIIGGSIPERDVASNKLFNTCTIWSPAGDLIGKFRKVRIVKLDF